MNNKPCEIGAPQHEEEHGVERQCRPRGKKTLVDLAYREQGARKHRVEHESLVAEDGTTAVLDRDPGEVEEEHAPDDQVMYAVEFAPPVAAADDDEQEVVDRSLEHRIGERPQLAEERARLRTPDLALASSVMNVRRASTSLT